jgi:hypothetical protein
MIIETKSAPTKAQMQAAIAQTLALPFAYNSPVEVLDFKVDDTGKISGRFKDSARPRVFDFELDGNTVNFKPYTTGRMDSDDAVEQWEEFSSGYSYRFDAKAKAKGKTGDSKKPQCVKPTAYNCGKACINIKNNCKSNPDDAKSKDRLEKLKAAGIDYAKEAKKSTPKSTAKTKKEVEKPPEIDKTPEKIEGKATESKSLNLVGKGDHESVPKDANEYYEAMKTSGNPISYDDAIKITGAVREWTEDASYIRESQKAGKYSVIADRITDYVKSSTPFKGEIYRGISFGSTDEALSWAKGDKDGILDNQNAHASWTSNWDKARKFAGNNSVNDFTSQPVIIKTNNKSGASIKNLSNIGTEDEVVVVKDTRHRVKNVVYEDGVLIVETEEVSRDEGKKTPEPSPEITKPQKESEEKAVKQPENKPKNLNLVGKGDHESMPSSHEEYYKALKKAGVNISEKEAAATTTAIYKWTRNANDIRADQKAGEENEDANRISNYVRNSTPYKGEVYRGIHFETKKEALNWTKGDKDGVLDNQGAHASWSSSLKTAEEFSDDFYIEEKRYPVVIKSINKSGASIKNLSNIKEEDEVMVLKDTRHRVKSVREENGRIIVEAEEV